MRLSAAKNNAAHHCKHIENIKPTILRRKFFTIVCGVFCGIILLSPTTSHAQYNRRLRSRAGSSRVAGSRVARRTFNRRPRVGIRNIRIRGRIRGRRRLFRQQYSLNTRFRNKFIPAGLSKRPRPVPFKF